MVNILHTIYDNWYTYHLVADEKINSIPISATIGEADASAARDKATLRTLHYTKSREETWLALYS